MEGRNIEIADCNSAGSGGDRPLYCGRCQMTLPFLWIKPPNLYSGRGGRRAELLTWGPFTCDICKTGPPSPLPLSKSSNLPAPLKVPPPILRAEVMQVWALAQRAVRRLTLFNCPRVIRSSLSVTSGGAAVKGGADIGRVLILSRLTFAEFIALPRLYYAHFIQPR